MRYNVSLISPSFAGRRRFPVSSRSRSGLRPEKVLSRFLSLLQSVPSQTFSVGLQAAKKASFRAVLPIRLGVDISERYAKSLSERRSLSGAWGLADLVYKLLYQLSQHLSLIPLP